MTSRIVRSQCEPCLRTSSGLTNDSAILDYVRGRPNLFNSPRLESLLKEIFELTLGATELALLVFPGPRSSYPRVIVVSK